MLESNIKNDDKSSIEMNSCDYMGLECFKTFSEMIAQINQRNIKFKITKEKKLGFEKFSWIFDTSLRPNQISLNDNSKFHFAILTSFDYVHEFIRRIVDIFVQLNAVIINTKNINEIKNRKKITEVNKKGSAFFHKHNSISKLNRIIKREPQFNKRSKNYLGPF